MTRSHALSLAIMSEDDSSRNELPQYESLRMPPRLVAGIRRAICWVLAAAIVTMTLGFVMHHVLHKDRGNKDAAPADVRR